MSGDAYCTASSVKAGRRLSGCSQGGRASNKASKVYRERVAFAKEALRAYFFLALSKLGDVRSEGVKWKFHSDKCNGKRSLV